ncbi:MAG: hypothetical protein GWM98_10345 [Nitrospinaceae bacterium]|nr:hypothetical protein [Nitrospinaceae bacterium]NIR54816.1 hypothetical protein [Nitrospinaceae bacterium]NIS85241.1 hypothetical protein [Nitrospinaceae bacterium]NIT82054.1 hypothetical protein [Nitrospinaceae bacterium]NIU44315.1 hypothetical protein [Nitrospinaceae bacterium]
MRNKNMKKAWVVFVALLILSLPVGVLAGGGEGPMTLPAGSNPEAVKHNQEGIAHWNEGHFDVALKHFAVASKIDSSIGEIHFNEAICLDKLGQHGEATMHFKAAKKNANGNKSILDSHILNSHLKH